MMMNERTIRQWDYPSEQQPSENIQFGYHSTAGEIIQITSDRLGAERVDLSDRFARVNGIAYGARPLKGMAYFEVRLTCYRTSDSATSLEFGVIRCEKGDPPIFISYFNDYCLWNQKWLRGSLVTPQSMSDYGYVDLSHLCEGDRIGLHISQDGVLEFFINSESQSIAAKNIYTRDSDIYAVVDHRGNCIATRITKAGDSLSVSTCMIMSSLMVQLGA